MTDRRAFIAGAAALIAAPRVARAQPAGKVRIGYLGSIPEAPARRDPFYAGFLGRLGELGWAEART